MRSDVKFLLWVFVAIGVFTLVGVSLNGPAESKHGAKVGAQTKSVATTTKKKAPPKAQPRNIKNVGGAWSLLARSQHQSDWVQAKAFLDNDARKSFAQATAKVKENSARRIRRIRNQIAELDEKHESKLDDLSRQRDAAERSAKWMNSIQALADGYKSGDNTAAYLRSAGEGLQKHTADVREINSDYYEERSSLEDELEEATDDSQKEIESVRRDEKRMLALTNVDVKSGVRFVVMPGSTGWRYGEEAPYPFAHYVAQMSNGCTAFLVHPRIAMTNRHCITSSFESDKTQWPIHLVFRRSLTGGNIRVKVTNVWRANAEHIDQGNRFADDWAFLKLAKQPLSKGHLELSKSGGATRIATAGYPGDLYNGRIMTALWGCPLTRQSNGKIVFNSATQCHRYGGASGSPYIAVDGPNAGKVIGIHAYGSKEGAGGGPVTNQFYNAFQRAREAWNL